nr:helix-turn-helix transcriptional regulator [uncultured Lichenicoccus sp.]
MTRLMNFDAIVDEGSRAGVRLRLWRARNEVSSVDLAARLEISRAALFRYEKGGVAKVATIRKIGDVVGLSFTDVVAPLTVQERTEAKLRWGDGSLLKNAIALLTPQAAA